jgi:hypothetical protein
VLVALVTVGAASIAQPAHVDAATAQSGAVNFGVVFTTASYGNLEATSIAVANADLSMLLSTNAQCIRIDIGYAPWLQNNQTAINEITGLVQQIRAAGKCLIIADAASESYRHGGQLTWSQFMAAWGPRVSTLAALYQPNYYIVIKEPGWYVPLISDATTNPQFQNVSVWLSLTRNLTNDVRAASPSTVVGVSIAANGLTTSQGPFYSQYLNQVQAIPGISFIGFDIYGPKDQTATQTYLSANPPSKAVWIPEAWSTASGTALNGSPSDDAQWIQSTYAFATSIHVAFLIPFFTDDFASYSLVSSPPTNSGQTLSLFQQRTPVFWAFQSIVDEASGQSTTSSSTGSSASSSTGSSTGSSTASSSTSAVVSSSSSTATVTNRSSVTSVSSSQASQSSRSSTATGGKGIFSLRVTVLLLVVFVVLVGAVIYFRRRVWPQGPSSREIPQRDPQSLLSRAPDFF